MTTLIIVDDNYDLNRLTSIVCASTLLEWRIILTNMLLLTILMMILLMEEILHLLIGSLSDYLQGFLHSKWCRISSINSKSAGRPCPMCAAARQMSHDHPFCGHLCDHFLPEDCGFAATNLEHGFASWIRWWFQRYFWLPLLGEMIQLGYYVLNGLKSEWLDHSGKFKRVVPYYW